MRAWSASPSAFTAAKATTCLCHVPPPVEVGDVLELGHGPILLLRVVDLVETGRHSPLAAEGPCLHWLTLLVAFAMKNAMEMPANHSFFLVTGGRAPYIAWVCRR